VRRLCLIFRRVPKIAKRFISIFMSARPSVRPHWTTRLPLNNLAAIEQLGCHWTDFHEIWCLRIVWQSVAKIQVSLKSDENNGYFTRRPINIFDHISNATNKHTGCVILIAFPLQRWLHERTSVLRYTSLPVLSVHEKLVE